MRIVAFAGPKSSGKDTAAKYLLARNSLLKENLFEQFNFAEPLKAACQDLFGFTLQELNDMPWKEQPIQRWPFLTPREVLVHVAKLMRLYYGGDVFAKRWVDRARLAKCKCVLITDLRHTEELDILKTLDAIIIYVQNDQIEKSMLKGKQAGEAQWTDPSESFYDLIKINAHRVITNNGSIADLHLQVNSAAMELLGDWTLWGEENPLPGFDEVAARLLKMNGDSHHSESTGKNTTTTTTTETRTF